jgi:hypothetical protein
MLERTSRVRSELWRFELCHALRQSLLSEVGLGAGTYDLGAKGEFLLLRVIRGAEEWILHLFFKHRAKRNGLCVGLVCHSLSRHRQAKSQRLRQRQQRI